MELKDFVSTTLTQIVEGVQAAQESAKAQGAVIGAPTRGSGGVETGAKLGMLWTGHGYAQMVEFDVALTVTDGTGTKGGIGVLASLVTLGSTGESKAETTAASRVKFTVPMQLLSQLPNS